MINRKNKPSTAAGRRIPCAAEANYADSLLMGEAVMIQYLRIESPLDDLLIVTADGALKEIRFLANEPDWTPDENWKTGGQLARKTAQQLDAYFAGRRSEFDIPLAPDGTPFQQAVWSQLLLIPFGTTISYGELAKRVGQPKAARAVGAANGCNPISIIIPCHRVIGANGKLTGYAGGLPIKEYLLNQEEALPMGTPSNAARQKRLALA